MAEIYDEAGNVIGHETTASDIYGVDVYETDYPISVTQISPDDPQDATLQAEDAGYFTRKIQEFQQTLFAVDEAANALQNVIVSDVDQMLNEQDYQRILALLDDYESRRSAFKMAAEAFNAVSSTVNTMGGSLPTVSIPQGLGFAPIVIPAALAAAIAGAAVLVSWAIGWLANSDETVTDIASKITDPDKRDAVLVEATRIRAAAQSTGGLGGALDSIASVAKWGGIIALAYIGWQMFNNQQGKKS